MSAENPLEMKITHRDFFALLNRARADGEAVDQDALRGFKHEGPFTPEEARDVLAKLLMSAREAAPLNDVPERSLISPITTEGRLVETESGRGRRETRVPTPRFAIENLAEKVVNLWANTQTTISVTWLEARKERANRRWEKTVALITDRENRLGQIKARYEGDFRRVTAGEDLPPVGTAEYDRELILFARERIAAEVVIDSMGRAAEEVGGHFARLRQERGMAQVDKRELPALVEEIKEVLPKRLELSYLRAKEAIGMKLALVGGAVDATVERVSEIVVTFFKPGVVLSSFGGFFVGGGIALARGILEVKAFGIHAGLGAGFALVSYIIWRKIADRSSDKKRKPEDQGTENI